MSDVKSCRQDVHTKKSRKDQKEAFALSRSEHAAHDRSKAPMQTPGHCVHLKVASRMLNPIITVITIITA
jgi:hypothetical protein